MRYQDPISPDRIINESLEIEWKNWDAPAHLPYSQRAMNTFWPTAIIDPPKEKQDLTFATDSCLLNALSLTEPGTEKEISAEQLLSWRLCNDALLIMHKDKVVHESYRNGMNETNKHVNHSTSKSLTCLLIAIAIGEGLIDPAAPITEYIVDLAGLKSWQAISIQNALDMSTGLIYEEHYDDPESICWSYFTATGYYPPSPNQEVGYFQWILKNMTEASSPPGHIFRYQSPISNALALAAAKVYGKPVPELIEEKLYAHIGAESSAWLNLDSSGVAITEGQLSLCLRDFARWAFIFMSQGKNLSGHQLVPKNFFSDILNAPQSCVEAWEKGDLFDLFPDGYYRNQTYVLNSKRSQIAMLGIHGQCCLIDYEKELMMLTYSSFPAQVAPIMIESMFSLWDAIAIELTA